MRLLKLQNVVDNSGSKFVQLYDNLPQYAILSHTWEDEEITYQELQSPTAATYLKQGYTKLVGFAKVALDLGWEYGWMDTCCINQSDLSELSEAINSMFNWYEKSAECLVYLFDATATDFGAAASVSLHERDRYAAMGVCKWFTRGWTLQELIAPSQVTFYTADWHFLADKRELALSLSKITQVDCELLRCRRSLRSFTIAERMSWAARRKTSRPEDIAYSLLGIFDTHMPLIYGEGARKAFVRLQEEILKRSSDHTILGWSNGTSDKTASPSVLSPGPAYFPTGDQSLLITSVAHFSYERTPYMLTNMGLRIRLPLIRHEPDGRLFWGVLDCHARGTDSSPVCIPLAATSADERRFVRINMSPLAIDILIEKPCMICDIFIEHDSITEAVEPTFRGDSGVEHLWSTETLEKDRCLRLAGTASTDQTGFEPAMIRQEILLYTMACAYMLVHLFPHVSHFGLVSDRLSLWYHLNLALTLYLAHQTYTDMCRGLWLAMPYKISEWSEKLADLIESSVPEQRSDGVTSPGHLYGILARALQRMLRSWALQRNSNQRQWQDAGVVDVFVDHGEEVEVMGMDMLSLSLSSFVRTTTLGSNVARLLHGTEWWQYGWIYTVTVMSTVWFYRNMRIPLYTWIADRYQDSFLKGSWLERHLRFEIYTASPGNRYLYRKIIRSRERKKEE